MGAHTETDSEKLTRFKQVLDQLIERLSNDRYVLAIVLVGSLSETTIWERESLGIWIVEADGVSQRLRSDGNDERIFRILVEQEINVHAEMIPRSRFKQMVEGSSRTAFSCNFFAERTLIYSSDPSIEQWFEQANRVATKDQERELLTFSTWTIHALRRARKLLNRPQDIDLAAQQILSAAHSVAYTEIIKQGEVWEQEPIHKAMQINPTLFRTAYLDVLADLKNPKTLSEALEVLETYLDQNHAAHLRPLLDYFKKTDHVIPLSLLSDHFAYSQIYPWHLESACEWLEKKGVLQKLSSPFKLTKRSQEQVEEPAYSLDK